MALRARTTKEVDQFHAAGLKAVAKDNGTPGLRTDYAPNYYAALLLDATATTWKRSVSAEPAP